MESLRYVYEGATIPVTLSAGGSVASEEMSTKQLAARADHALYVAKRAGRNRVRLYEDADRGEQAPWDGAIMTVRGA